MTNSGEVEQLKAALLAIPERLAEHSQAAYGLTQAWEQASMSFAALMTGSSNPLVAQTQALLGQCAREAFVLEGSSGARPRNDQRAGRGPIGLTCRSLTMAT